MTLRLVVVLMSGLLASGCGAPAQSVCAAPRVVPRTIYGVDDRQNIYELELDSPGRQLADAMAVLVYLGTLSVGARPDSVDIAKVGMSPQEQLCSYEPFAGEPFVGGCAGILVGPDVMLTHPRCLKADVFASLDDACAGYAAVFGYAYETDPGPDFDTVLTTTNEDVYRCTEVLFSDGDSSSCEEGIVAIRLDREVVGRTPIPLDDLGVEVGDVVGALDYSGPGLPLKFVTGAHVSRITAPIFRADLDVFMGGAAALGANGDLVGMLACRYVPDFNIDPDEGCSEWVHCGTHVTCDGPSSEPRFVEIAPYAEALREVMGGGGESTGSSTGDASTSSDATSTSGATIDTTSTETTTGDSTFETTTGEPCG